MTLAATGSVYRVSLAGAGSSDIHQDVVLTKMLYSDVQAAVQSFHSFILPQLAGAPLCQ